MNRTKADFTIVVFDGAMPTGIAASRDMLAAAALLAKRAGVAPPVWRCCSLRGGAVSLQGGMSIDTRKLPALSESDNSVWVLAALGTHTPQLIDARLQQPDINLLGKRLRHHVQRGGRVAASCASVFVLQAAGLLDRQRVTTTWWLAPHLRQMAPGCQVDEGRMLCVDGKLTTAGAAFAHIDLMLHLLKEKCGAALAELVASMMLIERKQAQAHFVVPELVATRDAFLASVTQRIEASLPTGTTVNALADDLGMSSRTLARRIQQQTGKSTLALIQQVKLRRAKFLLETSRLGVERIAESVGYRDAAALRRLMKREFGVSPKNLR